jgi:hypothetical protein
MVQRQASTATLAHKQTMFADDQLPLTINDCKRTGFHPQIMRADFTTIILFDQSLTQNIKPPTLSGQWIIARTFPQFCDMFGKYGCVDCAHLFLPGFAVST